MFHYYVGDLLIDDAVVGRDLQNIDLHFRYDENDKGERVFSDFGTGDLYREIDEYVTGVAGEEVVSLCLSLNMDKTHVSRLSDVQSWPCNVAIMNCKSTVLCTRKGSGLVGYCPILGMSERSLAPYLTAAGVTKSKHTGATRLLRKVLEQDFLEAVLEPVIELSKLPPIPLQYGSNRRSVYRTKIYVVLYICKSLYR